MDEVVVRASPVSPVDLRNQRQSHKLTAQSYLHSLPSDDSETTAALK